MKARAIILFFLTSAAAFAGSAFQKGIDAYHDSEYDAAASAFETAVTESETAAAHHNLALALYRQGKVSESVWHLERATLLAPENVEYQFKLGALRQQIGLPNSRPEWHELAGKALSQQGWITLLSVCFWLTLAALLLPKASGCRISLQIKAARTLGVIGFILAGLALYQSRHLPTQGIVLGESQITLHAAPASAAPQIGLARPGERGQKVDHHGDYIKIKTEGGASGWLQKEQYRLILSNARTIGL
jgi:tetratricopeptide (TPR) repeat protein